MKHLHGGNYHNIYNDETSDCRNSSIMFDYQPQEMWCHLFIIGELAGKAMSCSPCHHKSVDICFMILQNTFKKKKFKSLLN